MTSWACLSCDVSTDPWAAGARLLVDNSVWSRTFRPDVGATWARAVHDRIVVACSPFMMEAGYSARSGSELRRIREAVALSMDSVTCDERTWELAFHAQQTMADAAGLLHRRKPIDFLIAATAHQHGLGVLHYDREYDLIAEHGGLDFASVWVAPPGSLGP